MAAKDGMFYAAKGKPDPVVKPGEFVFSAGPWGWTTATSTA